MRDNEYGQLGLGHTINQGGQPDQMGDSLPAIDLGVDRTVVFLDAGHSIACAILDNGIPKCWGYSFSWSFSNHAETVFFLVNGGGIIPRPTHTLQNTFIGGSHESIFY